MKCRTLPEIGVPCVNRIRQPKRDRRVAARRSQAIHGGIPMDSNTKRTQLLAALTEQVEKLTPSEGWREWLAVAGRFHSYSLNNQLLILPQRPTATRVAGYRTWQS